MHPLIAFDFLRPASTQLVPKTAETAALPLSSDAPEGAKSPDFSTILSALEGLRPDGVPTREQTLPDVPADPAEPVIGDTEEEVPEAAAQRPLSVDPELRVTGQGPRDNGSHGQGPHGEGPRVAVPPPDRPTGLPKEPRLEALPLAAQKAAPIPAEPAAVVAGPHQTSERFRLLPAQAQPFRPAETPALQVAPLLNAAAHTDPKGTVPLSPSAAPSLAGGPQPAGTPAPLTQVTRPAQAVPAPQPEPGSTPASPSDDGTETAIDTPKPAARAEAPPSPKAPLLAQQTKAIAKPSEAPPPLRPADDTSQSRQGDARLSLTEAVSKSAEVTISPHPNRAQKETPVRPGEREARHSVRASSAAAIVPQPQQPAQPGAVPPQPPAQPLFESLARNQLEDGLARAPIGEPEAVSVPRSDQPGVSTTSPTTALPVRADLAPHVSRQIIEVLQHLPNRGVEISLSPEELGRVRLSMTATEAGVIVSVLAERGETLDLIRRHISDLQTAFQSLGYSDINFAFSGGGTTNDSEREEGLPQPDLGDTAPTPDDSAAPRTAALVHADQQSVDIRL